MFDYRRLGYSMNLIEFIVTGLAVLTVTGSVVLLYFLRGRGNAIALDRIAVQLESLRAFVIVLCLAVFCGGVAFCLLSAFANRTMTGYATTVGRSTVLPTTQPVILEYPKTISPGKETAVTIHIPDFTTATTRPFDYQVKLSADSFSSISTYLAELSPDGNATWNITPKDNSNITWSVELNDSSSFLSKVEFVHTPQSADLGILGSLGEFHGFWSLVALPLVFVVFLVPKRGGKPDSKQGVASQSESSSA